MNIDKNDNLPLKSHPPYDIIIIVVGECPVSAYVSERAPQSVLPAVRHILCAR